MTVEAAPTTRRCPDLADDQSLPRAVRGGCSFELWDGFGDLHSLYDPDLRTERSGWNGLMLNAFTVAHPLLAGTALLCAVAGRLRSAVIAISVLILARWLIELPSTFEHGLEFRNFFSAQETIAQMFIAPTLAACAIGLAIKGRRPALATAFACFPTLYNVLGLVIFIIGMLRYGF